MIQGKATEFPSAAAFLQLCAGAESLSQLYEDCLPMALKELGATAIQVVRGEKGVWRLQSSVGEKATPPERLLSEALDAGSVQTAQRWTACAIGAEGGNVVAVQFASAPVEDQVARVSHFAESLAAAVSVVGPHEKQQTRVRHLEAILEIAAQWNQTNEMVTLLQQMAET